MSLISLADAKAQVEIDSANVTFDVELQAYIDATTDLIERYIGPVENRAVVETVRGGRMLLLSQVPVVSITSLTDPTGLLTMDVANAYVSPAAGVIRQKLGTVGFADPTVVAYVAGRSVSGSSIPPAIQLAARIVVAHLWQTQRGGVGSGAGAGDEYTDSRELVPGYGYAMPNRALALLAKYRTPPGIA